MHIEITINMPHHLFPHSPGAVYLPGDSVTSIGKFTLVIDSEVIVRGGM